MALVQSISESSTGTATHVLTLPNSVTAGNFILVGARHNGTSSVFVSLADNKSNTYFGALESGNITYNTGTRRIYGLASENVAGGSSFTVTFTTNAPFTIKWFVAEYDNVPTSGVIDSTDTSNFTAVSPVSSGSIASSVSNDTLVGFAVLNAVGAVGISPNDGSTERQQVDDLIQLQDRVVGAAGTYSTSWTQGAGGTPQSGSSVVWLLKSLAVNPAITNVDGDNNITATQAGVVITGTNFGSDGANAKIELIDGAIVSQCTKTAWTDTSITFTTVQGNVKYGNVTCRITTNAGQTDSQVITLSPISGAFSTNVTTLKSLTWDVRGTPSRLTPKGSAADGTGDCTSALQFEYRRTAGSGTVTVDPDGRVQWQDTATQMKWRWHSGTVWSSEITWDLRGAFPTFQGPTIVDKTYTSTVAITSIDFSPLFADIDSSGTYTLQGGAITGLSLSGAGTLSGTPTVPATNSGRTIRRTDPEGSFVDSNAFTITVQAAPNPPFFSGIIPLLIFIKNGTIAPLDFSSLFTFCSAFSISPTLPVGLSFNTGTCVLTGTPTILGNYGPFTITGTGTGTPAVSNSFRMEVVDPPVEVVSTTAIGGLSNAYNIGKKKRKKKAKKLTTRDIIQSVKFTRK